jgi:hypothetical protein
VESEASSHCLSFLAERVRAETQDASSGEFAALFVVLLLSGRRTERLLELFAEMAELPSPDELQHVSQNIEGLERAINAGATNLGLERGWLIQRVRMAGMVLGCITLK